MDAAAKSKVLDAGTADLETIGFFETVRVAVGRADHEAHHLAAPDRPPAQLYVLAAHTPSLLERGFVPQRFFDCIPAERRVFAQSLHLFSVPKQEEHCVPD